MNEIKKMKKKIKENLSPKMTEQEVVKVQNDLINELNNNPEYSLTVDPTNKYNMSEAQKKFVEYYVQFKNVNTAADLTGIDMDIAKQYFVAYSTQQEVRRINRALYHRQFSSQLLSLDEIGGYLTSLLTDENVPLADQLKTSEKLKVAQMLMDLIEMKKESFANPESLMNKNLDIEIKNLSVETILQLLSQKNKPKEKIIIDDDNFSPEEKAYLETLPPEDLLKIIDDTNKKGE